MAHLYGDVDEISPYLKARKRFYQPKEWDNMVSALKTSTTLYVGNLSFYTEEEQIYALFSMCGPVRRIIMGIHKFNKTPCGFCFVEFYFHRDAMSARDYINGTKLDDRLIRVDIDPGFENGRQYGRGSSGGQVRDDRRNEYDEGRGGLPPRQKRRVEEQAYESGVSAVPPSQQQQHTRNNNPHNTHNTHNTHHSSHQSHQSRSSHHGGHSSHHGGHSGHSGHSSHHGHRSNRYDGRNDNRGYDGNRYNRGNRRYNDRDGGGGGGYGRSRYNGGGGGGGGGSGYGRSRSRGYGDDRGYNRGGYQNDQGPGLPPGAQGSGGGPGAPPMHGLPPPPGGQGGQGGGGGPGAPPPGVGSVGNGNSGDNRGYMDAPPEKRQRLNM